MDSLVHLVREGPIMACSIQNSRSLKEMFLVFLCTLIQQARYISIRTSLPRSSKRDQKEENVREAAPRAAGKRNRKEHPQVCTGFCFCMTRAVGKQHFVSQPEAVCLDDKWVSFRKAHLPFPHQHFKKHPTTPLFLWSRVPGFWRDGVICLDGQRGGAR